MATKADVLSAIAEVKTSYTALQTAKNQAVSDKTAAENALTQATADHAADLDAIIVAVNGVMAG